MCGNSSNSTQQWRAEDEEDPQRRSLTHVLKILVQLNNLIQMSAIQGQRPSAPNSSTQSKTPLSCWVEAAIRGGVKNQTAGGKQQPKTPNATSHEGLSNSGTLESRLDSIIFLLPQTISWKISNTQKPKLLQMSTIQNHIYDDSRIQRKKLSAAAMAMAIVGRRISS
ncbi:unnamed protein product [Amaranthus hypochondriacus]